MNIPPSSFSTLTCDVAIAGAGAAGLMAAIAAAEAGASVAVFEKLSGIAESSTAISVGRVSFCCTDVQRNCGVQDSTKLMTEDLLRTGLYRNDRALLEAFMGSQAQTWTVLRDLGVEWSPTVTAVAGMSVPRGHLTDPLELVRALFRRAAGLGVQFVFNSPVTRLIVDAFGGVRGCHVTAPEGEVIHVAARRGVILASGGFARDRERLIEIDPRFAEVRATSGLGHTGDALRMTAELGALTADMEFVQPSFEQHSEGWTSAEILLLYYRGGIIVNAHGERFIDESLSYKDIARACLDQPGQIGYQVIDQRIFDQATEAYRAAGQGSPMTLDAHRTARLLSGPTVEDLARTCGINPVSLRNTLDRYNADVGCGVDRDFSRVHLAGTFGALVSISEPPFYAYPTVGHLLATYAGLRVDPMMRVINCDGPISGLYAAGEAVGGFHGASYHSGTAISKALVFGRIAGQSAVTAQTH
jgi:fumarate reductase flavoprotein subunit